MKKFIHLPLIIMTLFAVVFSSCDNEPLEGEFAQENPTGVAGEGQFIATIAGESFVAESTQVVYFSEPNILSITGIKSSTGEVITMAIENPSETSFDLTQAVGTQVGASYVANDGEFPNPYISTGAFGGTGTLDLTMYDTDALTVSGTFAFSGARIQLDAMGMPVLDGSGAPVIETININAGAFNTLAFTIDDTMGGGGGGEPTPNPDIFFAKADGIDFVPSEVIVSQYTVGMTPMIQIAATDAFGASLRLDIPETLALGTFDLFTGISDGSNLIGYYNPNNGGETLSSNPGTITITEFSSFTGKLVASFEFTATDPLGEDPTVIEITEGNLDVAFVPTPGNVTLAFEAEVDGTSFTADSVTVINDTFNGVSIITITATMGEETIQLDFPMAATAEGTYGMSPALVTGNEIVGTYLPTMSATVSFTSDPGSFTITNFDETANVLEGTFSFSAKDASQTDPTVYEVTNGTFLVQL